MDEKGVNEKERIKSLHCRKKKETTYDEYGWIRKIDPPRKNIGNSTSSRKNCYWHDPSGKISTRLCNKRENEEVIHSNKDQLSSPSGEGGF